MLNASVIEPVEMTLSSGSFGKLSHQLLSLLLISFSLFISSCSLKYSESINSEDKVPEFVFEDTRLVRYEKKKPTVELSAQKLEQYIQSLKPYDWVTVHLKRGKKEMDIEVELTWY